MPRAETGSLLAHLDCSKSKQVYQRALDLELESSLEAIKARLDQLEGGQRNQ